MGIHWSLDRVDRCPAGRHTGTAPSFYSDFVEGQLGVKTEFCPDVAGFCPGASRILSLSDRNLSWSAVNIGGRTLRTSSICSTEMPVKNVRNSGESESVVRPVPVHDDLPRARATFETGYESAGADQVQFEQFQSGSAQWCVQESEICL